MDFIVKPAMLAKRCILADPEGLENGKFVARGGA